MPDEHGLQGDHAKRLHVVRLVARGMMHPHSVPAQEQLDEAQDLVERVIRRRVEPVQSAIAIATLAYLAVGVVIGFLLGAVFS